MSETQPLPLSIQPVISYPRQAQVGKIYMMTIDLQTAGGEWLYEEEEYPIYCMLDTSPLFSYQTLGNSAIILHRFGGTYGEAKFLLTASPEEMNGEIKVTLVNSWGVPIRVLSLDNISISQTASDREVIENRRVKTNKRPDNYDINPYVIGSLIDDESKFFGRQSIFKFIENNLIEGVRVTALHGQRRIGKSSILRQSPNFVFEKNEEKRKNFVFVFFDLQDKSRLLLGEVLYILATKIINDLNLDKEEFNLPHQEDFKKNTDIFYSIFIPQLSELLGNRNLVLLLDEFNSLRHNNSREINQGWDLSRYLKFLLEEQRNLFIIVVVENYPDDLHSLHSLFPSASDQKIGLLDEDDAKQLITQPSEGVLIYAEDAIQEILNLSAGHPYFTQAICSTIFSQARNENNWNVSRQDVVNIVNQSIERAEGGLAWIYNSLSIRERVVFSAIAASQKINVEQNKNIPDTPFTILKKHGVIETEYLLEAVDKLAEKGLLDDTRQRVKIQLVHYWLLRSHQLEAEIEQLEKVDAAAENLYARASASRQDGNILNAIQLYQEILLINPNHFSTLFELAEIYLKFKQFEQAVELYARIFQIDKGRNQEVFVEALFDYANQLIQQRKYTLAREQFAKILEIEPDNILANEQLEDMQIPPEPFVGRNSEIAIAFDTIYHRSHLAIWGGTGMGKTYFLRYIASPQVWQKYELDSSQAVIVFLNCESINPFTPSSFWREILKLIKRKLHRESAIQAEIDKLLDTETTKRDSLQIILRKLGERNKFLLLLVDNYDAALRVNEQYTEADMKVFVTNCRNLAVHSAQGQYISMIVTSDKRLNELSPQLNPNTSPWYNHYFFQSLKPFTNGEVGELLKFNIPNITPQLQYAIQKITGGHPTLVQIASSLLYRELQSHNVPNIEAFVNEFESSTRHIFQRMWYQSSEVEQTLLMLIALSDLNGHLNDKRRFDLSGIDLIFTQRERELMNLREQGVIIREADSKYAFTSSIMERWVIQEIWNSDDPTLKGRERAFLNVMSHNQVKKITTAMEWIWKNQSQVPSILDWFGKVFAAIIKLP
jgi:tetratricopeptide (TPR) repeat protein